MNIEEKIRKIICEQLGAKPEEVKPEADLINDLGVDSLDSVELVMAMEEEFNIEISDEDAEGLKTVGDIIGYLKNKTGRV